MLFIPYSDELDRLNILKKYFGHEYVLIRLTKTMIEKNNIDTNLFFREMLFNYDIVDYEILDNGGSNGKKIDTLFVKENEIEEIIMNFYKVTGKRSDPRFSIENLKNKANKKELMVDDLLYFTVNNVGNNKKVILINLTRNFPTESLLIKNFSLDSISVIQNELMYKLKIIMESGYHDNSKGIGRISAKDVGDTLEYLLGIEMNNSPKADYKGVEIKAKQGKTRDTLFTLRPNFEETPVARYEQNDRYRVSAFTRLYGYNSHVHPNSKSLYITIGTKEAPQNSQGFYLNVNEPEKRVEIIRESQVTGYWDFDSLKVALYEKHPATLWVTAKHRELNQMIQFKYTKVELTTAPNFSTFISLIREGGITYDWRGYTTASGAYRGKNHGNAWRINSKYRKYLFGELEQLL